MGLVNWKRRRMVHQPDMRVHAWCPVTGETLEGPFTTIMNRIADDLAWNHYHETDKEWWIKKL